MSKSFFVLWAAWCASIVSQGGFIRKNCVKITTANISTVIASESGEIPGGEKRWLRHQDFLAYTFKVHSRLSFVWNKINLAACTRRFVACANLKFFRFINHFLSPCTTLAWSRNREIKSYKAQNANQFETLIEAAKLMFDELRHTLLLCYALFIS